MRALLLLALVATACARPSVGPRPTDSQRRGDWAPASCPARAAGDSLPPYALVPAQLRGLGRLAFYASRDFRWTAAEDGELYTLDLATGRVTRLTRNDDSDHLPVWSRDGRRIAFVSARDHRVDSVRTVRTWWEIYVMREDGSGVTRLTDNSSVDVAAEFSRDGDRLLFSSSRDGGRQVYVMNTDGTNATRVTSGPGTSNHPDWSPDGRRLAFTSTRGLSDSAVRAFVQAGNVFIGDADGTNLSQLTTDGVSSVPRFSPDGRTIAFTSRVGEHAQLFLMNLDAGARRQLTRGAWHHDGASWSRDARWMTYETNRADPRHWAVWVVSADGAHEFPLLNHPCWRIFAANWSP